MANNEKYIKDICRAINIDYTDIPDSLLLNLQIVIKRIEVNAIMKDLGVTGENSN